MSEPSLGRSSRTMALGTLASRGTGFLRTAVIAAATGVALFGDAYAIANTTPNIIYELMLGGILTSVVVPLLVGAAHRSEAEGEAYAQRLLTVVGVGLAAITLLAVLAAPLIIDLYSAQFTSDQRSLAVLFARFFLPQIFFYGVGAVIGAILNTRGRFGAPMWTPVLNNVVVISTGVLFLLVSQGSSDLPGQVSDGAVRLLAIGTTLGIIVQTVALVPALRSSGFRYRPRFDLRGSGLGKAASLARWVLVYVVANQIGLLVVTNLASAAARSARDAGENGAGFAVYSNAFQIFQLPHAIVAVSVITALLPRMSRAVADGRLTDVVADLSRGSRLGLAALVPSAVGLIVLATPVATVIFARGKISADQAQGIGTVLAAFSVGLVPFSLFQLQLRAFYALSDTRTPALINIGVNLANIAVDVLLYVLLPAEHRVAGLALGFAASYAVGLWLTSRSLRTRLGDLDGYRVVRTGVRLAVAAVPAAVVAALLSALTSALLGQSVAAAVAQIGVGGAAGAAVFVLAARRMHVSEVVALLASVSGKIGR